MEINEHRKRLLELLKPVPMTQIEEVTEHIRDKQKEIERYVEELNMINEDDD